MDQFKNKWSVSNEEIQQDYNGDLGQFAGATYEEAKGIAFEQGQQESIGNILYNKAQYESLKHNTNSRMLSVEEARKIAPEVTDVNAPIRESALLFKQKNIKDRNARQELLQRFNETNDTSLIQQAAIMGHGMAGATANPIDIGMMFLAPEAAGVGKLAYGTARTVRSAGAGIGVTKSILAAGRTGEAFLASSPLVRAASKGLSAAAENKVVGELAQPIAQEVGIDYSDTDVALETLFGFAFGTGLSAAGTGISALKKARLNAPPVEHMTKSLDDVADPKMRANLDNMSRNYDVTPEVIEANKVSIREDINNFLNTNTEPHTKQNALSKALSDFMNDNKIDIDMLKDMDLNYKMSRLPVDKLNLIKSGEGIDDIISIDALDSGSVKITIPTDTGKLGDIEYTIRSEDTVQQVKESISDIYKAATSDGQGEVYDEILNSRNERLNKLEYYSDILKNPEGALPIELRAAADYIKSESGLKGNIGKPRLIQKADDLLDIHRQTLENIEGIKNTKADIINELKERSDNMLSAKSMAKYRAEEIDSALEVHNRKESAAVLKNLSTKLKKAIYNVTRGSAAGDAKSPKDFTMSISAKERDILELEKVTSPEYMQDTVASIDELFDELTISTNQSNVQYIRNMLRKSDIDKDKLVAGGVPSGTVDKLIDVREKLALKFKMSEYDINRMMIRFSDSFDISRPANVPNAEAIAELKSISGLKEVAEAVEKSTTTYTGSDLVSDIVTTHYADLLHKNHLLEKDVAIYTDVMYNILRKDSPVSADPLAFVESLLDNWNYNFEGSRGGASGLIESFTNKLSSLELELKKHGLLDVYKDTDYKTDLIRAYKYLEDPSSVARPSEDVLITAYIVKKHQTMAANVLNAEGTNLRNFNNFYKLDPEKVFNATEVLSGNASTIRGQVTDMFNPVNRVERYKEGRESIWNLIKDKLDEDKTFREYGILDDSKYKNHVFNILDNLTDGISSVHIKESRLMLQDSLDKLAFKDPEDHVNFLSLFGYDSLEGQVTKSFKRAGQTYGLLKTFGSTPKETLDSMYKDIVKHFSSSRDVPKSVAGLIGGDSRRLRRMQLTLDVLDGSADVPTNVTVANVGKFLRTLQLRKLNFTTIKGAGSDYINHLSTIRTLVPPEKMADFMKEEVFAMQKLAGTKAGKIVQGEIGLFNDVFKHSVIDTFALNSHVSNLVNKGQFLFSKLSGIEAWTNAVMRATSFVTSNRLYQLAKLDTLDTFGKDLVEKFGFYVKGGEWDIVKKLAISDFETIVKDYDIDVDGTEFINKGFMSADTLLKHDLDTFKKAIGEVNSDLKKKHQDYRAKEFTTDEQYIRYQNELAAKISGMIYSLSKEAATVPNPRTMSAIKHTLGRSQAGSVGGEIWTTAMQFKSFPLARFMQDFGRIVGRNRNLSNPNHSTFGSYITSGDFARNGGAAELASFVAATWLMETAGVVAASVLAGKTIGEIDMLQTFERTSVAGPYGVFLLNFIAPSEGVDPIRATVSELTGPTGSDIFKFAEKTHNALYAREEQSHKLLSSWTKLLVEDAGWNYPIAGAVFRSQVGDRIMETMDPGYAYEKEQKMKERTGQEYWIK